MKRQFFLAGPNFKTVGTIIFPAVSENNQCVPHLTGGVNNLKLSLSKVDISLESDKVCTKAFLSMLLLPLFKDISRMSLIWC